jgi:hypothetical protein
MYVETSDVISPIPNVGHFYFFLISLEIYNFIFSVNEPALFLNQPWFFSIISCFLFNWLLFFIISSCLTYFDLIRVFSKLIS